mmetsp:Transcript_75127/g.210769  ORF Transcript_75127/g.210769 Transcript_75127/m.210769 type:complete len:232 (-) Transcript_75127:1916-2611(-)
MEGEGAVQSCTSCGMNCGQCGVTRAPKCSSMSQTTNKARPRSCHRAVGTMKRLTSSMHMPWHSAMTASGWCCMSAPTISQQAMRRFAPSSSPLSPSSSSSPCCVAFLHCSSASRILKEAPTVSKATLQMCRTWSGDSTPAPAFLKHAVMPSAAVFSASWSRFAASETVSNLGRIRFRNSWTSCPTTSALPPSRAEWQSWPHVSKAMSRISSAMEKSKTSSRACAVCATKGA